MELSIIEKFVVAVLSGLVKLVNLLPSLPTEGVDNITSSMQYLVDLIAKANYLIPVSDIFLIAEIVVAIRVAMLLFFAGNWVVRAILDIIP